MMRDLFLSKYFYFGIILASLVSGNLYLFVLLSLTHLLFYKSWFLIFLAFLADLIYAADYIQFNNLYLSFTLIFILFMFLADIVRSKFLWS
jgi:hypothetical protein